MFISIKLLFVQDYKLTQFTRKIESYFFVINILDKMNILDNISPDLFKFNIFPYLSIIELTKCRSVCILFKKMIDDMFSVYKNSVPILLMCPDKKMMLCIYKNNRTIFGNRYKKTQQHNQWFGYEHKSYIITNYLLEQLMMMINYINDYNKYIKIYRRYNNMTFKFRELTYHPNRNVINITINELFDNKFPNLVSETIPLNNIYNRQHIFKILLKIIGDIKYKNVKFGSIRNKLLKKNEKLTIFMQ